MSRSTELMSPVSLPQTPLPMFIIPLSVVPKPRNTVLPGESNKAQTVTVTHPPVVCRAVVKLGDDLLAAILHLGLRKLELV